MNKGSLINESSVNIQICNCTLRGINRTGEMVLWLTASVTFPVDTGSNPSAYMEAVCNASFSRSGALF